MAKWNRFAKKEPENGDRVIICFWWAEGTDYQMTIGCWPYDLSLNWGDGCLPVQWTKAPDYPEQLP